MGLTAIRAPRAGKVRSLPELLRRRADAQPDDCAYAFLEDGERQGAQFTWGALELQTGAIAAAVAAHAAPGSRTLILCPPGLDFIPAFFGALAAGVIAVPCYPPRLSRATQSDQRDRTVDRLRAIVRDARPVIVLAPSVIVDRALTIGAAVPDLLDATWLPIENCHSSRTPYTPRAIDSSAIAFLQYTSGSTAEPRGVMVTHANLLHNLSDAHALANHREGAGSVSWLPVIHDMGLIQGVLQGAFSGFPGWLMSPAAFLQRPARWLEAISRTHATISGGPNFAYELCTRRITAAERDGLDLRSWRLAFNGAEPIRQATLDAFAKAFGPCGFDSRSFRPSYGLAEATLLVSSGVGATACCGTPPRSTDVRIVNPVTDRECPPATCGEIWIAGPGVAAGYWNQPDASRSTFNAQIANTGEGPFLRSGDLGSLGPEGLRITGRMKDILIVRGVKHSPQDIEETVERASPLLRAGCCAVFALPGVDQDLVGVAAELEAGSDADRGEGIIVGIREAVGSAHGIQVSMVALIAPGTIPKTTSGKLQRFACREGLLDGWLAPVSFWADAAAQLAGA